MSGLIELCVEFFIHLHEPLAQFVFIAVVCFLVFRDRLGRPAARVIVEMSLFFLVIAMTFVVLAFFDSGQGFVIGAAVCMFLAFLQYYAKTVREGFQKLLFMFFTAFHTASCLQLLVNMLNSASNVNIAVYAAGGWGLCRWFAPPLRQVESRHMKWLWTAPAVFYFISEYLGFSEYPQIYESYRIHQILFLMFLISSIVVCVLLLRVLDSVAKNIRLETDAAAINRQLVMQREQYERMMKNAETVKFTRHDMRHHLTLMRELARGETKLEEYIQNLSEKLDDASDKLYCTNYAVNAVSAHYFAEAEREGISVDARLEVPEDTGLVPAIDLCVIMGNLLENAVEACRRMTHGNKFIRTRARVTGDSLSLVVINSFDGLWRESGEDGVFLSRKTGEGESAREGVGLSSVKAICARHLGFVEYEITGDVWTSSALVHMEGQ